jgi:hypothetical protein
MSPEQKSIAQASLAFYAWSYFIAKHEWEQYTPAQITGNFIRFASTKLRMTPNFVSDMVESATFVEEVLRPAFQRDVRGVSIDDVCRFATAILIFTKGGETDKVFFYDMQSDGYSLDDKRVKLEGYGDLQNIITEYKSRATNSNDRSGNVFMVSKKEIVENNYDLSHSSYKEEVYEEVKYDEPKDILETLSNLENEIQTELSKIKSLYE